MKYLVSGAAGFIGSATVERLNADGHEVVGIDDLNDYYDVDLKRARLDRIAHPDFRFLPLDIADRAGMAALFANENFDRVIHLAAQAGVRYSLENPHSYVDSNLVGFVNIIEGCRHHNVQHLVYASSSSVYGLNNKTPFSTQDRVDHPISLYAATKKANEVMAHCYSHLYGLPTTGLRFFTVYGAWGRPDMAPFIFTKKILEGQPLQINNHGDMWRDFTHINDIVEGVVRIADAVPTTDENWSVETSNPARSSAPYALYNIGHGTPINLMDFITSLEEALGKQAMKEFREMQPGDVYQTYADTTDLFAAVGYKPKVTVKEGVSDFVTWYREFYRQ